MSFRARRNNRNNHVPAERRVPPSGVRAGDCSEERAVPVGARPAVPARNDNTTRGTAGRAPTLQIERGKRCHTDFETITPQGGTIQSSSVQFSVHSVSCVPRGNNRNSQVPADNLLHCQVLRQKTDACILGCSSECQYFNNRELWKDRVTHEQPLRIPPPPARASDPERCPHCPGRGLADLSARQPAQRRSSVQLIAAHTHRARHNEKL